MCVQLQQKLCSPLGLSARCPHTEAPIWPLLSLPLNIQAAGQPWAVVLGGSHYDC